MGTLKHIVGWLIAFIIVMFIGFFKEGYDKISDKGTPDLKDLFCNTCDATTEYIFTTTYNQVRIIINNIDKNMDLSDKLSEIRKSVKIESAEKIEINEKNLSNSLIYSFGDSIAYGVDANRDGYSRLLSLRYGCRLKDFARAGATFTQDFTTTTTRTIYNQINEAPTEVPDIVLFNGFINDCDHIHYLAKGLINEDYTDEELFASVSNHLGTINQDEYLNIADLIADTTFTANMEACCKLICDKYQGAQIIFVATHKTNARLLSTQNLLYNRAIEVCKKYGIKVADVHSESPLNTFVGYTKYIAKGSHPNYSGYHRFYLPIVYNAIAPL